MVRVYLQMLAAETGGRYHRSHGPDFNADLFAHKVLQEGFTDEVCYELRQNAGIPAYICNICR